MLKFLFPLISVICIISLLYGGVFKILDQEKNQCRMTYMFEYPQFVRINYEANNFFPKYALYAYSEGSLTERARSMAFTGAPVIFIPGNSGSYKQARSFASVAIRKGIDNGWTQHLDYYTVDLNAEYTGVFGGYLYEQQQFIKSSIRTVLNLYKKQKNPPKQVVLIGHSMGGKLAQSILIDPMFQPLINTVISLAGPIDKPVLNLDSYFDNFYSSINKYFATNRTYVKNLDDTINYCNGNNPVQNNTSERLLDDKLFITIGGGNRDLHIHSGLTYSNFSDLSVLSSSIPYVWLTTDHLCSVWCLQLILVINRFLHNIITPIKGRYNPKHGLQFLENKTARLIKAKQFFDQPRFNLRNVEVNLSKSNDYVEWYEDSRRVYTTILEPNQNKTVIHMIRLVNAPQHKYLSVTAINMNGNDWVFGCAALEVRVNYRLCSKGTSLSHLVSKYPTFNEKKSILNLDLHKLKENNSHWTHILLKFPPSKEKVILHVDTHDSSRHLKVMTPKWYSFQKYKLLDDTLVGSSFYKLEVSGLEESYQSIQFNIKPRGVCSAEFHHSIVKVCIPWIKYCHRFQHFTDLENSPLYLNAPLTKPSGYNTTNNPISVYLHLDPNCRYQITYMNSFGSIMSRIFQQYIHWIPAHITAIILLGLRHQISITPSKEEFKCGKLHVALLTAPSFFLITTTRIISKMLLNLQNLAPNDMNHSMLISVIIHGSSYILIVLITLIFWIAIYFYGNIAHKLILMIIKLPIPVISDLPGMSIIEKIPLTAGVILIAIAVASCGGLALLLGCVIYFMLIVKHYEDYLEEFVFRTAKIIALKLFGTIFRGKRDTQPDNKSDDKNEDENTEKTADIVDNDKPETKKTKEDIKEPIEKKGADKKDPKKRSKKEKAEKIEIKKETENKKEIENKKEVENKKEIENKKELENKKQNENKNKKEIEIEKEGNEMNDDLSNITRKKDELDDDIKKEISEKSEILLKTLENSDDVDFPDDITDEELDKLLAEAIEKQAKLMKEKKQKEALERLEFDSVHESFSSINFHMTLFLLLCILALLNLPATISWAQNYSYNKRLIPDPSLIPATISLLCLSILWQISAPRNVQGYMFLSIILYVCGAFSILYCQDSIYRLNYLIPFVYGIITLMQIFIPKKSLISESDLHEMDLHNKVERIRALLKEEAEAGAQIDILNEDIKDNKEIQPNDEKIIDNTDEKLIEIS